MFTENASRILRLLGWNVTFCRQFLQIYSQLPSTFRGPLTHQHHVMPCCRGGLDSNCAFFLGDSSKLGLNNRHSVRYYSWLSSQGNGPIRHVESCPDFFFFTARVHTTKFTIKILATNTHCKYFFKIAEITHFFCTRNCL
jgi:hypothetical protein